MIALDGRSGREVATVRLRDGDGKLLDGPLVTDDGRVIVARQAYDEARASLRVYRLEDMGPGSAGDDAPPPEPAPADAEPAAAEARRSFTSADDSAP
jgi:hypothetical protein